jgi:hypothetical protein
MSRRVLLKSAGFTAMGLSFSLPAIAADDSMPGTIEAAAFGTPPEKPRMTSSLQRTKPQPRPETDFSLVRKVTETKGDGPDHPRAVAGNDGVSRGNGLTLGTLPPP